MAVSTNIRDKNTSLRTRINNDKVSSKLKLHLLVGKFVLLRVIFM